MTDTEHLTRMVRLHDELAPLEMEWEPWAWGRWPDDGFQHVRRDGSVIVITDDSHNGEDRWLVGFYTAAEFAAAGDLGAAYVYCESNADVVLAIIDEGQARDSGSPWRLDGESDAAYAERCLRNGTLDA